MIFSTHQPSKVGVKYYSESMAGETPDPAKHIQTSDLPPQTMNDFRHPKFGSFFLKGHDFHHPSSIFQRLFVVSFQGDHRLSVDESDASAR